MNENKETSGINPYPFLFRLGHLIASILILVMIVTGWGIYTIARPGWSFFRGHPSWLPPGRLGYFHLIGAVIAFPVFTIMCISLVKRRGFSKISNPRWLPNYLLAVGGTLCALSGIAITYSAVPGWFYHSSRLIHAVTGAVVIPIALLVHLFKGLGRFRKLIKPIYTFRAQLVTTEILIFVIALALGWAITTQMPLKNSASAQLHARKVSIDTADIKKLPWDEVKAFRIQLANGHGFNRGRTEVRLRAMHDGTDLLVLAEWDDPEQNLNYWPWEKTRDGWKQLVSNPKDETVYYEDKFSLLFPIEKNSEFENFGCSVMCHQSTRMPYGLKITKKRVDVWHWKACRTDPYNYVDDKYWEGTDLSLKEAARRSDPKDGGGYTMNVTEDKKYPVSLPTSVQDIRKGAILKDKSVPFNAENDIFPVGTRIPGLVTAPISGDRGNVKCISEYNDGKWRLYIRRALDTGSEYDVIFKPGNSYPFACAAFDHSAKRHAYNHEVYKLVIDK